MFETTTAPAPLAPAIRPPLPEVELTEILIRRSRGWVGVNWVEMFQYRELFYFLLWRDVKVRYKQTVLGVFWVVLQPVLTMLIATLVFGRMANITFPDLPYSVAVFAGLVPWTFFSNGLTQGGQSLVNQQSLLTKIYFPRLFVPAASVTAGLIDMSLSFVVMAIIMAFHRIVPGWSILALPALLALTLIAAMGIAMALSALTVAYRDFRYIIGFMVQFMMFASPVYYPLSNCPERYRWIFALNPMTGLIDGYRSAILNQPWNIKVLAISSATSVACFILGLAYFRLTERRFADIA
jgi:lipopolysaccharide transport system permease protein